MPDQENLEDYIEGLIQSNPSKDDLELAVQTLKDVYRSVHSTPFPGNIQEEIEDFVVRFMKSDPSEDDFKEVLHLLASYMPIQPGIRMHEAAHNLFGPGFDTEGLSKKLRELSASSKSEMDRVLLRQIAEVLEVPRLQHISFRTQDLNESIAVAEGRLQALSAQVEFSKCRYKDQLYQVNALRTKLGKKRIEEIDFDEEYHIPGYVVSFMGAVFDRKAQRYIRVKRIIHSPFWRAMHNLFAHPLKVLIPRLGDWLHDYTAAKMYNGPQDMTEVPDVHLTLEDD